MSFNRELFIKAGAHQMSQTRPDIWSFADAESMLRRWMGELEGTPSGSSIGLGGFMLFRTTDDSEGADGVQEFRLSQSVVDYAKYNSGEDGVFVWGSTGGDKIPRELVAVANGSWH